MSSWSLLCVCLSGASLSLLLPAVKPLQSPSCPWRGLLRRFVSRVGSGGRNPASEGCRDTGRCLRPEWNMKGVEMEEYIDMERAPVRREVEAPPAGGVQAQYYEVTPPDYGDYNVTFEYSFYSNTSSEDLDQFSERFIDGEEDKGGRREEQDVTVTITTTRGTTERGGVNVLNAASLPVPLEIRTLLWTLVTLISLQHTL